MVGRSVVDSVTHKVMISDTTLRSFIPPQVCKMTPKLRQICGFDICTIHKGINIDLNIFKTILVTNLQQKSVGRHTRNSLFSTTSNAHYKYKVFPDGGCLHGTIKYAAQYIPIKPNNMIHIKCDLGFCDECTK